MFLFLCLLLVTIVIGTFVRNYITNKKLEKFDLLLTTDPVNLVHRRTIDDSIRNVLFNRAGGIMTISRNIPENADKIHCPYFIDELTTLGKNNVCWLNRV